MYERSLSIREQQLGENHPHVASSLNNLAGLYSSQGRYPEAEPLYERSIAILRERLGDNHPNTQTVMENYLICLNNLADFHQFIGNYEVSNHYRQQANDLLQIMLKF